MLTRAAHTGFVVCMIVSVIVVASCSSTVLAQQPLWSNGQPQATLIVPNLNGPMRGIVGSTINGHLAEFCGWKLPMADKAEAPGFCIVVGDEKNNLAIAKLVREGLKLDRTTLGTEGFLIKTHESDRRRFVIITANTPVGLKHGCQELIFFCTAITDRGAAVDWPLDVAMKPAFAYRGVYMLPCWSAYDSIESWRRVLKFHSELTLNRNWFWLAGFPLLPRYGGEYEKSDLAQVANARQLMELCRSEGMKFYIGGGWFTWHHAKAANGSIERGAQWYLDMLELLPQAEGIYLEPAGEGSEADEPTWRRRTEAMEKMAKTIWQKRPDFELAIAIGRFNDPRYRQMVHRIDDKRIYWWWCWGDPMRQNALAEHPVILRWHTIVRMSDYHGSTDAPVAAELPLAGFATSYDPGQGYGNPWNGWGKLGYERPRNIDPRTMPFFSHQYLFREHCWNVNITPEAFAQRLSRRLFDADMPAESIDLYLKLAATCPRPAEADPTALDTIAAFVEKHSQQGTLRNRDTLARMREAIDGIRRTGRRTR